MIPISGAGNLKKLFNFGALSCGSILKAGNYLGVVCRASNEKGESELVDRKPEYW